MKKLLLGLALFALVAAACGEETTSAGSPTDTSTSEPPATAVDCAASAPFVTADQLTIGTDNPAYPPYFAGGETDEHDWKFNDPYTGEGFEAAIAYEVAARLGFTEDAVEWTVAPFNQTYKPGPKDYDFAIEQISYSDKRDNAVDFSDSYYDVNQALVVRTDTPIAKATDNAGLAEFTFAAPIGTTSYDLIDSTIQPNTEAGAYETLALAVAALNAKQIDAIVVDLPTALYLADPFVQEAKNSTVLAQYATAAGGEHFGMSFVEGNGLRDCVNLALKEMTADGTLVAIQQTWLSEKTNVGEVPVFG